MPTPMAISAETGTTRVSNFPRVGAGASTSDRRRLLREGHLPYGDAAVAVPLGADRLRAGAEAHAAGGQQPLPDARVARQHLLRLVAGGLPDLLLGVPAQAHLQ